MRFEHVGFDPHFVDYLDGWDRQRAVHAAVVAGDQADTVLLLEHAAVFTAGKRTLPLERPFDGTPVIDVDRGGKITWHGPGQLVGYPIVRLPDPIDVVVTLPSLPVGGALVFEVDGTVNPLVAGTVTNTMTATVNEDVNRINNSATATASAFLPVCHSSSADAGVGSLSIEAGRDIRVADIRPYAEAHLAEVLDQPGGLGLPS